MSQLQAKNNLRISKEGIKEIKKVNSFQINRSHILETLKKEKTKLEKKYHILSIGLFGSYNRQEENDESDIDILVEFKEIPSLFEFVEMQNKLTDIFGKKVNLVMKKVLKKRIGEEILKEVSYI